MEPKVSEEYRKLYHYTTWEGLLGILQTQTLWATHGRFLNDYSELVLFRDKFIDSIVPIVEKAYRVSIEKNKSVQEVIDQEGGLVQVARNYAAAFVDAAYKATGEAIYIVSFCGEDKNDYVNRNGLLSQWRGYGIGGGIALVLDTKKLEEIMQKEAERYSYDAAIADVIYSDDDEKFNMELSSSLTDFANFFKECINNARLKKKKAPDSKKAFPAFINCISRYKHHSFKEENEVRIVCALLYKNEEYLRLAKKEGFTLKPEKERKFRTKNGKLIPYIELFNSTDIVLPIERIIVGPHKEKDSRASALRVMLRNMNIEITVSDIPYVD
jgi:hypothetical protein